MRRKAATIYAGGRTLALAAGFLLAFYFAWQDGTAATVACIVSLALGLILAPILHELGHVVFAKAQNMDCVYVKCFCLKVYLKDGKKRWSFASPFAPDETQVHPKSGGNMQKRAAWYTLGGLIFGGIFLVAVAGSATLCCVLGANAYLLWGALPYAGYLFFLNALPLEYGGGKTDMLVYRGLKTGADAERTMLAAMEIQGELYAGKSFAEIDGRYYFELPQLREDEPLFAVMLDLKYRYYLECGDEEKAVECLNRLASVSCYLTELETEKVAAELTYLHAIRGDLERAEESSKLCRAFLRGNTPTAKRVLLAYSKAVGKTDALPALFSQAEAAMATERLLGVRKFEKILISRIERDETGNT